MQGTFEGFKCSSTAFKFNFSDWCVLQYGCGKIIRRKIRSQNLWNSLMLNIWSIFIWSFEYFREFYKYSWKLGILSRIRYCFWKMNENCIRLAILWKFIFFHTACSNMIIMMCNNKSQKMCFIPKTFLPSQVLEKLPQHKKSRYHQTKNKFI